MAHMYVEVDLSDVDDDELIEEVEARGYQVVESKENELLSEIYHARRLGKPYDHIVDKLIYDTLGKVI